MDITNKSEFTEVYDDILIETNQVSSVEWVQNLVLKVLEDNKQIDYNNDLVLFIKKALDTWVPINWLTWEVLFNIFWQEFDDVFEDNDKKEIKKRERFISEFRTALFYSNIYSTKDDIGDIVLRVLSDDKYLDTNDSLVNFIKKALDNWVPINNLTWDELSEALNVLIPWVKIISDRVTIKDFDLNLMNWTSFIYWSKMLVFVDWKMLYCDISMCNRSCITNNNEYTIRKYMQYLKEDYKISKRVMELIVEQCNGFYPLK